MWKGGFFFAFSLVLWSWLLLLAFASNQETGQSFKKLVSLHCFCWSRSSSEGLRPQKEARGDPGGCPSSSKARTMQRVQDGTAQVCGGQGGETGSSKDICGMLAGEGWAQGPRSGRLAWRTRCESRSPTSSRCPVQMRQASRFQAQGADRPQGERPPP